MLKSVEGIYREGKVELFEPLPEGTTGRVIVTFVSASETTVDLPARGMDRDQAANLRSRLATFAEDWQRPEMDAYDADNLATVLDSEIDRRIGCCKDMQAVDAALRHTLGLV